MNKVTLSIFAMCTAIVCIMVGSIFLQSCEDQKDYSTTHSYVYKVTYVNGDIDTITTTIKPNSMEIETLNGTSYIDLPRKGGVDGDLIYVRKIELLKAIKQPNKTLLKNKQKIE